MRGASLRLVIDEDEVVKKSGWVKTIGSMGERTGSPPIKNKELKKMTDEVNVVNDTQQEVVGPEYSAVSADEVQEEQNAEPAAEVAPVKQSVEENQAFAQMRRNWEQSQREAAEAGKRLSAYQEGEKRLSDLIQSVYGFGGSFDEIADQIEAEKSGRTVDEIREQRFLEESARAEQERQFREMEYQRNYFRDISVQKMKADFLSQIKEKFPECSAKSVDEFGNDFAKLVEQGIEPAVAYAAYSSVQNAGKKPTPPEIGAVNSKQAPEKEYYTREEMAKMSKAQIHKNWSKVKKSYFK